MPYPQHIEQKLEFNQIRAWLLSKCLGEVGQSFVHKMRFVNRFDLVEKMLLQTKEFKTLLEIEPPFPAEHYYNIQPSLNKSKIEGAFLEEAEWFAIKLMLVTYVSMARFFEEKNQNYPNLTALFSGVTYQVSIAKNIDAIIDNEGNLKPNASAELAKISAALGDKQKEVRAKMNRIFEKAQASGWLANSGITLRDGRLVLPVLAEYKKQIPGLVHDESATGQTFFIEPADIFDTNNHIRELQLAYKREREKILIELTNKIRPHLPDLEKYLQKMGIVDFIRAKALLAMELDADLPMLTKNNQLVLHDAYHPILWQSHKKQQLPVIPLSVSLTQQNRVLVISGPNAGGKSVALKTIGLLQYSLQCGLLVSCKSFSEMSVFQDVFVDIGDEQSIENDLSTYSSHLKHMKHFTEFANGKTLFLIDEFGTGTDPQFGGPLAEAILNKLNQKQAFGVVNTHYSNLKNFAGQTNGLINARMLFDQQNLKPTYKLEVGQPGSSYAFEIAQKTGLANDVIAYAKQKVGDKQKRLDDLLIELEREKNQVNQLKLRFEEKDRKAHLLFTEYDKLKTELEENKKQLLHKAKQEALAIVSEANSRIEQTIREIKEKQANSETIKQVRNQLKTEKEALVNQTTEHVKNQAVNKPKNNHQPLQIAVGQWVSLVGQEAIGEVLERKKDKAFVAVGDFKLWFSLDLLEPVKTIAKKTFKPNTGIDLNKKMQDFSTELNLIGVRGEDAKKLLQDYLDDAFLLGFKQVRIVHGKGYGILRKLVREYLKTFKHVEFYTDEMIELGGDGVTLVTFKI